MLKKDNCIQDKIKKRKLLLTKKNVDLLYLSYPNYGKLLTIAPLQEFLPLSAMTLSPY